MNITAKSKILFLFFVPILLYVSSLKIMPLLDPDETRYSEIADAMVDTGDYVTPRINHVIYLEKPPLTYWASALMFKIFGENEFSARLFSGLCAWGCILLVYAIGSFLHDDKTGLYSAGVLSTFLYIYILGHMDILDIPLTLFVCMATWAGYRHIISEKPAKGWLYLLYTASALAFLTKGLIGIVFPFITLILWLVISKKRRDIFRLFSPAGLFILIMLVSPWLILVQRANKDFLWFFFIHEHLLRYTTKIHERYQSIYFYLPVIVLGIFPWLAYLIDVIWNIYTNRIKITLENIDKSFLITWIVFIFAFFSISSSKLIPYIAPIFVPTAVIIGYMLRYYDEQTRMPREKIIDSLFYYVPIVLQFLFFSALLLLPLIIRNHSEFGGDLKIIHSPEWIWLIVPPIIIQLLMIFLPGLIKRRYNTGWFLTIYLLSAFFLTSLLYPASAFLAPYKSSYPLAQIIKFNLTASDDIYQYKIFLYGIESYTDIRTSVVDSFGEMNFGMQKLPADEKSRYFLSQEEFFRSVKQKKKAVYCVTSNEDNFNELKKAFPNLQLVWSNDFFYFTKLTY